MRKFNCDILWCVGVVGGWGWVCCRSLRDWSSESGPRAVDVLEVGWCRVTFVEMPCAHRGTQKLVPTCNYTNRIPTVTELRRFGEYVTLGLNNGPCLEI